MSRGNSLYECANPLVNGDKIYCSKGHKLGAKGTVEILRLVRGERLIYVECQGCEDFDRIGLPIPEIERGWSKLIKETQNG